MPAETFFYFHIYTSSVELDASDKNSSDTRQDSSDELFSDFPKDQNELETSLRRSKSN